MAMRKPPHRCAWWVSLALVSSCVVQATPFDADKDPQTLASLDGIVERSDGVPPLLGMAASQSPEVPASQQRKRDAPDRIVVERLQRQVQVQKRRIAELSRTIAALNEHQVQAVSMPSPAVLAQLREARDAASDKVVALQEEVSSLQKKIAVAQQNERHGAEQIAQLTAQLKAAQTVSGEQLDRLHAQEAAQRALEGEVAQVRSALTDNQQKLVTLQQEQVAAQKAHADVVKQKDIALQEKEQALLAQTKSLKELQSALDKATATPARIKPEGKAVRDYAVGTALAKDMLALLAEREADGVKVDKVLALAGVQDAFAGDLQVSDAALAEALSASEREVTQTQAKRKAQTEKAGQAYMADFARRKGVKKHPDGFLYRIDFGGNDAIADTDTVTIVVKESLTDGTVINDMDVSGALVSQPLNAYPGLFQSAIRLLKTHGSVTLVVPPELAYGDKGYPPQVPPGATIVYALRIHDVVKPQGGKL
ncbi:FKBP-type peptidyl-prolyl cis-trans isomerase N-terminal domain-containing protein [Serratia marcescens]|uniref:FKBP-type peptidyl-prolyl cis-trans isomerase N-terminal domain-containing protein n=1 Tax=Serratia marcescens TaxID=615 RepID=UPI003F840472